MKTAQEIDLRLRTEEPTRGELRRICAALSLSLSDAAALRLRDAVYPGRAAALRLMQAMLAPKSLRRVERLPDEEVERAFALLLPVWLLYVLVPVHEVTRAARRLSRRSRLVLRFRWLFRALAILPARRRAAVSFEVPQ